MPEVKIISESAAPAGGWLFVAEAGADQFRATLSWADYNLWSPTGCDAPQAVMKAVLQFLGQRGDLPSLGDSFDCALARRLHRDADAVIPGMIDLQ